MAIAIASAALTTIVEHAAIADGVEACGLLVGTGDHVALAIPAANVAARPTDRFEIDPAVLLRVQRKARSEGRAMLGCYHSHPNGVAAPSAVDAAAAVEEGRLWLIASAGAVSAWRACAGGVVHARFEPLDLAVI